MGKLRNKEEEVEHFREWTRKMICKDITYILNKLSERVDRIQREDNLDVSREALEEVEKCFNQSKENDK